LHQPLYLRHASGPLPLQTDARAAGEEVLSALRRIIDPDFGEDIVSCGFVKDLSIDQASGAVGFTLELTTPACPVKDQFKREATQFVQVCWQHRSQLHQVLSLQPSPAACTVTPWSASPGSSLKSCLCASGLYSSVTVHVICKQGKQQVLMPAHLCAAGLSSSASRTCDLQARQAAGSYTCTLAAAPVDTQLCIGRNSTHAVTASLGEDTGHQQLCQCALCKSIQCKSSLPSSCCSDYLVVPCLAC
jgi:metal-sulfur cluster biosynthetic enzyme